MVLERVREKLRDFREKQTKFGEQSRDKALIREQQKVAIQEERTKRLQLKAQASLAKAKVRQARAQSGLMEARASKIRAGSSSSLFGTGGMGSFSTGIEPARRRKSKKGKGKKRRRSSSSVRDSGLFGKSSDFF